MRLAFDKYTYILSVYIIISAAFMSKVFDFLNRTFGRQIILWVLFSAFALVFLLLFMKFLKEGISIIRLILFLLIFAIGIKYSLTFKFLSERFHLFNYGLLGWLACSDCSMFYIFADFPRIKAWLSAILWVSLISLLDEGFQKILPYRVFDVRDLAINMASGLWGILLFTIITKFDLFRRKSLGALTEE